MMKTLRVAAAVSTMLCAVSAQLPIPGKPPGFVVGHGSADAGVQLETFVDLLCPDSKSAYLGLKKLAEHYEPDQFRVKFVLFPLPYHQHAFAAAEAAFTITTALGDNHFTPWLETIYTNQDIFWNKQTKDLTPVEVTKKLQKLAQQTFPALTDAQWEKGMTGFGGTDADDRARTAWKYACSRGKSGTPLYNLNGVPFDADATWSFDDWFKVIDPLVKANEPSDKALSAVTSNYRLSGAPLAHTPDRKVLHFAGNTLSAFSVCAGAASGVRPCEFVPGRAMCCQRHEACVLRTGCVALK
uniref:Thioredoxin-like fold domain-containing protein n=1 Tax=Globisporangium ultimum (strain ATCC 200006 / CBS 805.95 / DAOM BR144) TaxID=431595 RepID=K3WIJ3_GLOUD